MSFPYPTALRDFPRLRQSLLATFDRCSKSAEFEIAYTKGWATHPQGRGRMFHRFAARALMEMARQREETIEVDVGLAILSEVLRQHDVDRECPGCGAEVQRGIVDGMRTCVDGHRFETELVNVPMNEVKDLYWVCVKFCHDNSWDIANLVDVEVRLETKVEYPNPDGLTVERVLTGQPDALFIEGAHDERAIVIDYKDTWDLPGPTDLSFGGYLQQRFYAMLVMDSYPSVQDVTLREFYVRRSEPREATIGRHHLDHLYAEFAALAERFDRAYEEASWTPSPGEHCSYCPRPTACPIPKWVRGKGKINTQEEAEVAARQLVVAKAIVGQNTDALNGWAAVHGPIPLKDVKGARVLGHRAIDRTSRPTKEQLKQAIENANGERVDIESLYVTKKGTRFEEHTPPQQPETDDDAAWIARLQEAVGEGKAAVA